MVASQILTALFSPAPSGALASIPRMRARATGVPPVGILRTLHATEPYFSTPRQLLPTRAVTAALRPSRLGAPLTPATDSRIG